MSDDNVVRDRSFPPDNPCDCCKWRKMVSDQDFPCSHCIHNACHV